MLALRQNQELTEATIRELRRLGMWRMLSGLAAVGAASGILIWGIAWCFGSGRRLSAVEAFWQAFAGIP